MNNSIQSSKLCYSRQSLIAVVIVFFLTSCTSLLPQLGVTVESTPEEAEAVPQEDSQTTYAEIQFHVYLPEGSDTSNGIYVDILDIVTGISFNVHRYQLTQNPEGYFSINIPFPLNSILKYRYTNGANSYLPEYTAFGTQVNYRMIKVNNPDVIVDHIAAWQNLPFNGSTGKLEGIITDISGSPIPDVLVSVGGYQTISSSNGYYQVKGLEPGQHTIFMQHINGYFDTFQQGAVIASEATTPADVQLNSAKQVSVTFKISAPNDTIPGAPIRMFGNLYSLGNTFGILQGGMSSLASRAPILSHHEDGTYTLTVQLPAGYDLRYKYSLGDAFWNCEIDETDKMLTRQLIVPDHDIVIDDQIVAWHSAQTDPIVIQVQVPEYFPVNEVLSIQFNPFDWMTPIPMWPSGEKQWTFILYGPYETLNDLAFRFCRNDQCNNGSVSEIYNLDFSVEENNQNIVVNTWPGLNISNEQITIVGSEIVSRSQGFLQGFEMLGIYDPSWQTYLSKSFANIKSYNSNSVVLTPTWHYFNHSPVVISALPGHDPLWTDMKQQADWANGYELDLVVFPQTNLQMDFDDWQNSDRDQTWLAQWFGSYKSYLRHFVDFAEQNNARAVVLGESSMEPFIPGIKYTEQENYEYYQRVLTNWQSIIPELKTRFSGDFWLSVDSSDIESIPEEMYALFDGYYVNISDDLSASPEIGGINENLQNILDSKIKPVFDTAALPVILTFQYPSVNEAEKGCGVHYDACNYFTREEINLDLSSINTNAQLNVIEGILQTVNSNDWIDGIYFKDYYPPAEMYGPTANLNGKESLDLIWYWFSGMTGAQ